MADKQIERRPEKRIRPVSSICECKGSIMLRIEMPGVNKDGLDINIENDELRIAGRRPVEKINGSYIVHERPIGDFYHSFTLDVTVDRDNVKANLENGVLNLTLGLREEAKPRMIEVH